MPTTQGFSDARILARWSLLGISTRHSQARGDAAPTELMISWRGSLRPLGSLRCVRLPLHMTCVPSQVDVDYEGGEILPSSACGTAVAPAAAGRSPVATVRGDSYAALGVSASLPRGETRSDHIRLHIPVATPKSARPAKTVALSATYPAITDIETAVPTTRESSPRPSPLASRASIRPSELYCIDGPLFSFDRYPPEVSHGILDANRIERVVGATVGEMTGELHHLGGREAPCQQHRPLAMTARHQLPHAIQPTRKGLPRGQLTVNLSLRCGELCNRPPSLACPCNRVQRASALGAGPHASPRCGYACGGAAGTMRAWRRSLRNRATVDQREEGCLRAQELATDGGLRRGRCSMQ